MVNHSETLTFIQQPLDDLFERVDRLAFEYQSSWGLSCVLVDVSGQVVRGQMLCQNRCPECQQCASVAKEVLQESVRWGESFIQLCPKGDLIWAVPVMQNQQVIGALIALGVQYESETSPLSPKEIRHAMIDLLHLAARENLTNTALLELRRLDAKRESDRAGAIHEVKGHQYQSIRDIYLVEEPGLIAAIKQGDRKKAREIINRVLVGIYYLGRDRPVLLKSLILELIVTMSRSAVEAGGDPNEVLGANYSTVSDLAQIESEEALCSWVIAMLERIMDAIKENKRYPISVLLGHAIQYMQENLQEDLSRDQVAEIACLSPSHFSRVLKQNFGYSFTELMARMRVDKARDLLLHSEKSLLQICMECGLGEQSYFTKVFQRYIGKTPGEYRKMHRSFF